MDGDVGHAQRLVRETLGNAQNITFSEPFRSRSEGVTVICGRYAQGDAAAQRYVAVLGSEQVFVEPQMGAGEMDRAFVEFCNQGAQNPAQPAPPSVENAL